MQLPKYIEKKIIRRASLQNSANALQREIESWCDKNGLDLKYKKNHLCLFDEPIMVACNTISELKGKAAKKIVERKCYRKCGICGVRGEQREMKRAYKSPNGWLCSDCHKSNRHKAAEMAGQSVNYESSKMTEQRKDDEGK